MLKLATPLIGAMLIFWLSAYVNGAFVQAVFAGMTGVMIGVICTVFYLDDIDDE